MTILSNVKVISLQVQGSRELAGTYVEVFEYGITKFRVTIRGSDTWPIAQIEVWSTHQQEWHLVHELLKDSMKAPPTESSPAGAYKVDRDELVRVAIAVVFTL
mgnify:CR=1 FL=1